jgi:hypothetical protein
VFWAIQGGLPLIWATHVRRGANRHFSLSDLTVDRFDRESQNGSEAVR